MLHGDIQIQKLRPGEEKALFAFLDEVYASQPAKRLRALWNWQYKENPFVPSESYSTWVCWDGDRIVGQRPLMPFRLWVDGREMPAAWAVDFIIRPDYRGRGIGLRLMEAILQQESVFVAIDSSARALRIYEKLGCVRLPDVPRFIFLHKAGQLLQRWLPWSWLANLLTPLANQLLTIHYLAFRKSVINGFQIIELNRFDPLFDDLWQRSRLGGILLACRTKDFLIWRYAQAPGAESRIVVAQRGSRIVGYLVWRMLPDRRTLICDIWSENVAAEVFEALLRDVIQRSGALMSESIECYATHSALKRALVSCGFYARGGRSMVVHPALSGVRRGQLARPQDWYVTALDSDIDPMFR